MSELTVHRAVPGPEGPASSTTPRRPGSIRRTTTHDSLRPDGLLGPVTLVARGRDLLTDARGVGSVVDAASVEARIGHPDRTVAAIDAVPADERLEALVGVRASAGFRGAVDEAMPGERGSRSVRFQLLDDLPTALLVSGYALMAGGATGHRAPGDRTKRRLELQHPDMCAGWVSDGVLMSGVNETGLPPPFIGTVAPRVDPDDDPLAWHDIDDLPVHGMRRRRRLDVWDDDGVAVVESFFRDSYMDADGVERVVHEYTVYATVDPATKVFRSCRAQAGSLPWPECPGAAASAARLEGTSVDDLRRRVRQDFVGLSTCTHLNDTLRSLEDVGALVDTLLEARSEG